MKNVTRIALPIVLSLTAAAAMASEFTPEAPFVSTMSRAEVRAQAIAARDAGQIASGEFSAVFVADGTSTLTRAQVRTQAIAARNAGQIASGEFSPVIVADGISTLTRAQVRAEAVEAQRLGLIARGEELVLPTPAQLEQVRLAGLRATQADNLAQGQNQRVTN